MTAPLRCLFVFAALAVAVASGLAAEQNFNWNGRLDNGKTLTVLDINGSINASPSSGNQVEIVAVKTARGNARPHAEMLADVEIKVQQEPSGIVVCTLYRQRNGTFPTSCNDRIKGSSKPNIDVRVEYTVRMPARANLDASTVNGSVAIRGLMANVEAKTVNGGVDLETNGHAQASTVNGTIRATVGNLDSNTKFSTVNGRIIVAVRDQVNANVSMSTVNGSINTDFPITTQGKISKRSLKGTIGAGGPELRMSTVNGSIQLEKAS